MSELSSEERQTLDYYNRNAKKWASEHEGVDFWREEARTFKSYLPLGKVLDVGAGGGRDAELLTDLGFDYLGVETAPQLLAVARKYHTKAQFKRRSIYNFSLPSRSFDGFWMAAVLLHVPKLKVPLVLSEIEKVVRSGGVGFISLKQGSGERVEKDEDGFRFWNYYEEEEFSELLEKRDWEILESVIRGDSSRTRWLCFWVRLP